ncbi:MAG: hypothetical protein SGJ21_06385 [Alphaproteobacteria bacterium]|nr:hypothetical protein [Alphaproteobacteria bacterium]
MSESALKSAFEAVLNLPEENQAEVAQILLRYVEEQRSPSLLTGSQRAEVRRRLSDPDREMVPHEEVVAAIRRRISLK